MRKIKLDLTQLTQAHIDRAMPHREQCAYSAPCLIGTLMTEQDLAWLKKQEIEEVWADQCSVDVLTLHQIIEFAEPGQESLAQSIQNAFDLGEDTKLQRLLCEVDPRLTINADA